jgi:prepilin-type N-terminal cleavage/methylation domain-containing protein
MNDFRRRLQAQEGYNLVELMVVVGIMGVLSAVAVVQTGPARTNAKGDAAMRIVLSHMNQAREMAIGQRRYMRVVFDSAKNQMSVVREDTTVATTTLSTIGFEGGAQFTAITMVDTPDGYSPSQTTSFTSTNGTFPSATGSASVAKFTPDGTLVDWNGRTANGTVFLALPNVSTSTRAVTVLGSTGRVRAYRWDGRAWKVV